MATVRYNAIIWDVHTTNDASLILKQNEIGVAQTGAIYFGDGVSKLSELVAVIAGGTLTAGQVPDIGANKINKLNGSHAYDETDVAGVDVIGKNDTLNEALAKLQNQIIGLSEIVEAEEEN